MIRVCELRRHSLREILRDSPSTGSGEAILRPLLLAILGLRFQRNPIRITPWGLSWGIAGMLIVMPLLAAGLQHISRVFSEKTPKLPR